MTKAIFIELASRVPCSWRLDRSKHLGQLLRELPRRRPAKMDRVEESLRLHGHHGVCVPLFAAGACEARGDVPGERGANLPIAVITTYPFGIQRASDHDHASALPRQFFGE